MAELDELFGTGGTSSNPETTPSDSRGTLATDSSILEMLGAMERGIDNPGILGQDGFGSTEDLLLGTGGVEGERTATQEFFRAISDFTTTQDSIEGRNARNAFLSVNAIEAYDSLRNAGAITEAETRFATAAQNRMATGGLTAEEASEEISRIRDMTTSGQFRQNSGIRVSENYLETRNGQNVITYRDENGNFIIYDTGEEQIHNLPAYLSDQAKRDIVSGLPENARYFYQGTIYTRPEGTLTPTISNE